MKIILNITLNVTVTVIDPDQSFAQTTSKLSITVHGFSASRKKNTNT